MFSKTQYSSSTFTLIYYLQHQQRLNLYDRVQGYSKKKTIKKHSQPYAIPLNPYPKQKPIPLNKSIYTINLIQNKNQNNPYTSQKNQTK